jgi:hypothetical protein
MGPIIKTAQKAGRFWGGNALVLTDLHLCGGRFAWHVAGCGRNINYSAGIDWLSTSRR